MTKKIDNGQPAPYSFEASDTSLRCVLNDTEEIDEEKTKKRKRGDEKPQEKKGHTKEQATQSPYAKREGRISKTCCQKD